MGRTAGCLSGSYRGRRPRIEETPAHGEPHHPPIKAALERPASRPRVNARPSRASLISVSVSSHRSRLSSPGAGGSRLLPLPTPPISGDWGLFVQAPPQPPVWAPLLFFSGRDIEDDLASENVRSWWKETCWR